MSEGTGYTTRPVLHCKVERFELRRVSVRGVQTLGKDKDKVHYPTSAALQGGKI